MKKRILSLVLASVMILGCLAGCGKKEEAPVEAPAEETEAPAEEEEEAPAEEVSEYDKLDKVYIGVVTSLSGDYAAAGEMAQMNFTMWSDDVNAAGGINGKEVEIVYEDDQSTTQGAANAYQKLAGRGDISAIWLPGYSSLALSAEPYVTQYQIPSLTTGSSVKFAEIGNDFIWQVRSSDSVAGATMGSFAIQTLGMTKVAIIHESDSFGQGLNDVATEKLIAQGMAKEDILEIVYNKGEKNFAPFMAQIKEFGADGIIGIGQIAEAALVATEVKAAGLDNLPRIGSNTYQAIDYLNIAQDAAVGWYSVTDWTPDMPDEKCVEFTTKFVDLFDRKPDTLSPFNYDGSEMIKWAIEECGSQDPVKINEQMAKVNAFEGYASTYTPDENNILPTTQYVAVVKEDITTEIVESVVTR